ncbi:MAG: FAD-dependent oxidoreductase [Planctomycetota bacterium]|nr:FAD-dependent oxidoreductase [Planctomycetota bacterium]
MKEEVVVIGGGPGGMCAAIEAARCGASVTLIEDKPVLGGQLVKQTHMFFGSKDEFAGVRGIDIAKILADEVERQGVKVLTSTTATGIFDGNIVGVTTEERYSRIVAERIIVATGAYENPLGFINRDLPGVYGAGGVQTLMNVEGVLPGERFVMVGAGNIGLIVSYQLIQAGAEVVCVVEALERIGGYEVHAAKLRRLGVPILLRHTVVAALGKESVEGAVIAQLDEKGRVIDDSKFGVTCDAICIAVGLSPLVELLVQAGCKMMYVSELGGYVAWHDENQRTSVENIYVAGDSSGIEEASTAMLAGRIAGICAALSLKKERRGYDAEEALKNYRERLSFLRAGPFGEKARRGKESFGIQFSLPLLPSERTSSKKKRHLTAKPFHKGPVAVIECNERIPCNPCVDSCRFGAIRIEGNMNEVPLLEPLLCRGCGECVIACPGLAIFLVDKGFSESEAEIGVPYEMADVPKVGDKVMVTSSEGDVLCEGRVTRVRDSKKKRRIVFFGVPKRYADKARGFLLPSLAKSGRFVKMAVDKEGGKEDFLLCICEDVWRSQVEALIDAGYHSFDELKRILRCGMGACQGKTCQRLILNILSRKLGVSMSSLRPHKARSPVRPTPLEVFASCEEVPQNTGGSKRESH